MFPQVVFGGIGNVGQVPYQSEVYVRQKIDTHVIGYRRIRGKNHIVLVQNVKKPFGINALAVLEQNAHIGLGHIVDALVHRPRGTAATALVIGASRVCVDEFDIGVLLHVEHLVNSVLVLRKRGYKT